MKNRKQMNERRQKKAHAKNVARRQVRQEHLNAKANKKMAMVEQIKAQYMEALKKAFDDAAK